MYVDYNIFSVENAKTILTQHYLFFLVKSAEKNRSIVK